MRRILGLLVFLLCAASVSAQAFDEFGYNYKARLFNGFYGHYDKSIDAGWVTGTGDAMIVMKWSKDWTPMADEPVGAWTTNHFTWYADEVDGTAWYGWDERVAWTAATPAATYRVEEFLKIMKVGDDAQAWAAYQAGGAYSAGWGAYASGVPKYVVFQDTVNVYEQDGDRLVLVESHDLVTAGPKGLGKPIF